MPVIEFGKAEITYRIERSPNRKTVNIAVDPEEGVIVTAPAETDKARIREIVNEKAPWIIEKQELIRELSEPPVKKEFLSGEKLPYLGRNYRLKVIPGSVDKAQVALKAGRFIVRYAEGIGDEDRRRVVREALRDWYFTHAEKKLKERVRRYAQYLDVAPRSVKVKHQQKRWGSCTKNREIYYNWRIIMAPMSVVDYVVVHELCHLREKNHTERFWRLLGSVISDYDERKEYLRVNGPRLIF